MVKHINHLEGNNSTQCVMLKIEEVVLFLVYQLLVFGNNKRINHCEWTIINYYTSKHKMDKYMRKKYIQK